MPSTESVKLSLGYFPSLGLLNKVFNYLANSMFTWTDNRGVELGQWLQGTA